MVTAANGAHGAALGEIYDADPASGSRLINLSARATVTAATPTLIAGLSITGDQRKTALIRAAGPSLSAFGVGGAVVTTKLDLYSAGALIASDQGWSAESHAFDLPGTFRQLGAFPFATNSADSALLVTLQPGTYTVHLTAPDQSTGTALIEVYDVTP